jgi:hypothetical protein
MAIENIEFEQEGLEVLGSMDRPVPGQSLTSNPDEPKTWEQAPEYSNMRDALDFILSNLMNEKAYMPIINAIAEGIPISDIVQQILYIGFNEGKWNPDMLLMLLEPLMYIIMALCEKAGINYTLYRGEEEDEENTIDSSVSSIGNEVKSLQQLSKSKIPLPKSTGIPQDILQKIEQLEIPQESLMAKQTIEKMPPSPVDSLLTR